MLYVQVPVATRMWGRALLLVLLTALTADGDDAQQDIDSQLKVGKSINIFSRYGYLSLSMRVVSRNDSDWVFREPTLDIFTDVDNLPMRPKRVPKKAGFQGGVLRGVLRQPGPAPAGLLSGLLVREADQAVEGVLGELDARDHRQEHGDKFIVCAR